ncbi:hypothetical protein P175DRAFT_0463777 [Aspergillus ochraceoroseus IBT 24754]|uniref:Conserved oligomeric Golgi complex subunit 1 n=2 Tax=Aspergillus subgen. Nidulantes TaxID=2720870 RepID=A0A0F8VR98_9EURO|nr:uncharacterized protein P175DRAFT_0463777 [Aspergillus ochraceoroseus IBT 24754]KKK25736.1 hypothetical protein ARAM_002209 [Aspergillus rambellii]PTU18780.1 hypothetical protein P175DRAFT_0463777 [Aspergillus ochraceoroseus IBT 24754]
MALDGPDPQSLKSWQDAFQYPIPTVRRVEQELRRDVASNKEKLRAFVGTRYRELVGTAETIVSMNREMEEVDSTLADIGRRCNPRLMGKKYAHLNQINSDIKDQDVTKRVFGAQLALLHRCSILMSRLLRKRSSPLLIAKLFVISRPIHKTLSEQKSVPPFLEILRNQLASLKRSLRNRINKRLASAKSTAEEVIEALAAYCLATSSSLDDAVAYYHKLRLDAIGNQLELTDTSGENILAALRLYIQTLQISKTLLSRRFSDVLGKLKVRPLLADPEIRNLDDLGLDVLGRWVAADIINFTPWIKLNEFSKQDAERTIKKWSKSAFDSFVHNCQATLTKWVDFSKLLLLRKETLELWLRSWGSTPVHSALQVLEGIRTVFNSRLTDILSDDVKALDSFGQTVASAISGWDKGEHSVSQSLWDDALVSLDYSNGGEAFKESISDRLLGRDEDTSAVFEKYKDWLCCVENLREAIDGLRQIRWSDVLDEATDEDIDIDVAAILSEDDRQLLWEALGLSVKKALDALQTSFSETFKPIEDSKEGVKAAFLLKLVRLVRRDLPREFVSSDLELSKEIVPQLQELLAADVVTNTHPLTFATPSKYQSRQIPGRSLWEGEPEIPIQPSPSTFKFLRRMVGSMDRYGPGLWDTGTVYVLESILQKELADRVRFFIDELKSSTMDKSDSGEEASPVQNGNNLSATAANKEQHLDDLKMQLYFDTVFLNYALAGKDAKQNELSNVAEQLRNSLGSNTERTIKTMDQKAQEYWHRTRLLFGLLAVDTQ